MAAELNGAPRVAIVGAAGYGGTELVRLVAAHPWFRLGPVASRSHTGRRLREVFPWLESDAEFVLPDTAGEDADVVLLSLPAGLALELAPRLLERGKRVIDLSGDFRTPADIYRRYYGREHTAPGDLAQAVYGLTELHRAELAGARLVANPGCYADVIVLMLAPLATAGLLPATTPVTAGSGVSGAGRTGPSTTADGEAYENLKAYKAGGTHQHTPEIELSLSRVTAAGKMAVATWPAPPVSRRIVFNPLLVPMVRGILAVATVPGIPRLEEVRSLYERAYADEPFVELVDEPPATRPLSQTNRIQVHLAHDPRTGTLTVIGAVDNLGKGASGQAVQNLNAMHGRPETEGLADWGERLASAVR
jgi:N-acetyl-gamma-glutamyl-phosphate reductase